MSNIGLNKQDDYLDLILTIKQFFNRHQGGGYVFAVSVSYLLKKEVNKEVIEYCQEQNLSVGEVELKFDAGRTCLEQLQDARQQFGNGIILTNIDKLMLLTNDDFAYQINGMREALFSLHIPILIWLTPENHSAFTHKAIDLYTRRDLDTLFFPEIEKESSHPVFSRSEMPLGQQEDAQTLQTRVILLEKQLETARKDDIPRKRIANEIVFPLIRTYHQLLLIDQALSLFNGYRDEFENSKRDIYNEIGKLYHKAGNLEKAIQYFEKALNVDQESFGMDSIEVGSDYNNLSLVWKDKKDIDKALEYTNKALDINLKLYGENNEITAASYNNIAGILKDYKYFDKALEYANKSLSIAVETLGKENEKVAIIFNTLGIIWQEKGNLDKAIDYYEKSLAIELKLYGIDNPNVAVRYNNLGLIWNEKNNTKKAISYYEKAIKIDKKLYGEESINIAFVYNNLGYLFEKTEKIEKAINSWSKAYNILSKTYGIDHEYTKALKFKIDQYQDIDIHNEVP